MPSAVPVYHFEYCLADHTDKVRGERVPDGCLSSTSINDLWLYFFHENLIAIRHQIKSWSYYVNLEDCESVKPEETPPSIERLNQVHLDIVARDFGGDENREVTTVPLEDIANLATKLIGDEISEMMAKKFNIDTTDD